VFAFVDRYKDDTDSSEFSGHRLRLGLGARVHWAGRPATVMPVGGVGVAVGREWTTTEQVIDLPSFGYRAKTEYPATILSAGANAGVQVRVSDRVALSFEYALRVMRLSGERGGDGPLH
jgi:hypothetical protein